MKRLLLVALLVAGCAGAASTPVTTSTPTAVPLATEEPTPELVLGTGVITFGKNYDPDTLEIVGPATKFKNTAKTIAWSASFSEPAGATSVTFIIASRSKTGVEATIIKTDVDISNPDNDLFANKLNLASLVDNKVGTYVMRYLRDATLLAEGTFTLTK